MRTVREIAVAFLRDHDEVPDGLESWEGDVLKLVEALEEAQDGMVPDSYAEAGREAFRQIQRIAEDETLSHQERVLMMSNVATLGCFALGPSGGPKRST